MITTVQTASIWNVGIKTAAAQNMVAIGFIEKAFGRTITWLEWLVAAAPFGILMSVALYFVMIRMMPPEVARVPGGRDAIRKSLADLGPIKASEMKLLAISLTLLAFWATEGVLHRLDTSTTTITAVALMFLPGIGIMTWKEAQPKIPWGTVVLFGVGISLGTALLQTKGALWLADIVVAEFGLKHATTMFILGVMTGPDLDPSGICQRDGFGFGNDPHCHRSPSRRRDARHQRRRHDHAAAVRRQLRVHSRCQRASEHGGVRHRCVRGARFRAHRTGPDTDIMLLGATYWRWLGYV
jgi:Na+/H+ antiporter NhaD/arsenite permease-like protein